MMKKIGIVLALAVFASGCATYQPSGSYFVQGTMGKFANSTTKPGPKQGEACVTSVLGLFASGDASVEAAMNNGGINKVATLDYKVSNMLGLYGKYCTVLTGS